MNTSKKHTFWTEREIQLLQNHLQQNHPLSEICQALTKTEKSIRRKCERLKLSCSTKYQKKA